jgi:hypothetical protein
MNASIAGRLARFVAPTLAVTLCTVAAPVLAADPVPAPTVTPAPAPAPVANDANAERSAKRLRNIGIGTFGVGVVMIGVGAGLEHKRRTDICKTELSEDHANACDDSLRANISVLAMGSVMFVGGAVLAAIGSKRLRDSKRRVAFAPQFGRRFAGAAFAGRF